MTPYQGIGGYRYPEPPVKVTHYSFDHYRIRHNERATEAHKAG